MKALIYNGKVVEIAEESNDVASPFEWINISNTEPVPEEGWSYDGIEYDIFKSDTWTTVGGGVAFGGKMVSREAPRGPKRASKSVKNL